MRRHILEYVTEQPEAPNAAQNGILKGIWPAIVILSVAKNLFLRVTRFEQRIFYTLLQKQKRQVRRQPDKSHKEGIRYGT